MKNYHVVGTCKCDTACTCNNTCAECDTLIEAIAEIKSYRQEYPDAYDEFRVYSYRDHDDVYVKNFAEAKDENS